MTSRRGRRKYSRFNRSYEIPKPRTPLSCEKCGETIYCTTDKMLAEFLNHECREAK